MISTIYPYNSTQSNHAKQLFEQLESIYLKNIYMGYDKLAILVNTGN